MQEPFWTRRSIVFLAAFAACFLWGSASPCIKIGYSLFQIGADDTPSRILFAGLRFFLAGWMVVLYESIRNHSFSLPKKGNWPMVLKLMCFQTIGQYIFFYMGLAHTSGVRGSIINASGNFFAILFADMNNFHAINNTYGHDAGDAILRMLALALRKYGRKTDRFCRWGGDEFVGLLQLRDPQEIITAARRLKKISEECCEVVDGKKIYCEAAIGITVVKEDDTIDSLIKRADTYMYQEKKKKKDRIITDYNTDYN